MLNLFFVFWLVEPFYACMHLCWWLLWHWRVPQTQWRRGRSACVNGKTNIVGPWRKPDWVRQRVMYYAMFRKSCREVAKTFNAVHGWHMTVSHTWVNDFIRQHADEIADKRRAMRRRIPLLPQVGVSWALDLTYFISPHGVTFTVLGIIDKGSRRLLALKVLPRKCAFTVFDGRAVDHARVRHATHSLG